MDATRNSIFHRMQFRHLTKSLTGLPGKLLELLLPGTCLTCENHVARQGGCCPQCWRELRFVRAPYCPVLGTPFSVDMGSNILSAEAMANPPPFERLRCVMLYDDLARRMVSGLKFSDRSDLVPWMAEWMRVAGAELIEDGVVVVPVPLHRRRMRSRRYNQSAELARQIARKSNCNFCPEILLRKKPTHQQIGLSQKAREKNVAGAFVVPESTRINLQDRRVLLVDDVYTTGATVKSATRALKRGGAKAVDVLVFAKVETHLD